MGLGSSKILRDNHSKIVQNNSKESSFPDIHEDSRVQLQEVPDYPGIFDNKSKSSPRLQEPISVAPVISPISQLRRSPSRYPSYPCKRVSNVLDFRKFQPMRPNSESKLNTSDYDHPMPLERRWTGLANPRPAPKTWVDELKKSIEDLAVTRAPTTIDPPDLSFPPLRNEEITNSPVEENDQLTTTEECGMDEILEDSVVDPYDKVKTVESPSASDPSSDSDYPETVPDVQKSEYDDMGDSDCSTSRKFWAKHPKARLSGSRIASFMIAPIESEPCFRTKTSMINRNAKNPAGSVRNSISAQEWKSVRATVNSNRNKTSVSCESFHGTNCGPSKVTNSDQYKQPPSEPLNYSSENEETDTTEVSDEDQSRPQSEASDQSGPQSEASDQSRPQTAKADKYFETDDDDEYFSYRIKRRRSRSPELEQSELENRAANSELKYNSSQSKSGSEDSSDEKRVKSVRFYSIQEEPELDKWSSCSDYGIDQITPPSELARIGTYSEDEFSKHSSGDEGKLQAVVQKANLEALKHETLPQSDEKEIESSEGTGGTSTQSDPAVTTASKPLQRKRKGPGLLCRKFFGLFKKQSGN